MRKLSVDKRVDLKKSAKPRAPNKGFKRVRKRGTRCNRMKEMAAKHKTKEI